MQECRKFWLNHKSANLKNVKYFSVNSLVWTRYLWLCCNRNRKDCCIYASNSWEIIVSVCLWFCHSSPGYGTHSRIGRSSISSLQATRSIYKVNWRFLYMYLIANYITQRDFCIFTFLLTSFFNTLGFLMLKHESIQM